MLKLTPVKRALLPLIHWYRKVRYAPAESVLDNLADSISEDVCINVPEFNGRFYLDTRSALFRRLARDGYYEPELTRLCSVHAKPDRDIIDIGANIGFHTVFFAKIVEGAKVLAVEPTTDAFSRLRRNVALNEVSDGVILHQGAVSNNNDSSSIKVIPGREEFSTLGTMAHQAVAGEQWQTETVQCYTLDTLVNRFGLKPGFIKLDVEGAEHLVIQGALATLEEHRPVILAELSNALLIKNGSSAQDVIQILENANYNVLDANSLKSAAKIGDYGEVLCIPR